MALLTRDEKNGTVPTDDKKPYDVEQIRRQAKQSILQGAVTPDYPLDLKRTHELLNEALATEILCVLRYRHHQIIAKGINYPQVAAELEEHANSEQEHLTMLAERIDQLGGDPDLNPATVATRSAAEYGRGTTLAEMIQEDLVAERVVIEIYRRLIDWFGSADPTTRRMLEHILAEEEEHASDLASLLESMGTNKAADAE